MSWQCKQEMYGKVTRRRELAFFSLSLSVTWFSDIFLCIRWFLNVPLSSRRETCCSLLKLSKLLWFCQLTCVITRTALLLLVENKNVKGSLVFWVSIYALLSTSSVTRRWSSNYFPGFAEKKLSVTDGNGCLVQGLWVIHSWSGLLKHTWSLILCKAHRRKFSLTSFILLASQSYSWW